MKPDETDMSKLISTQVCSINSGGDYLYYYQKSIGSGEGFGYMFNATGIYRASKKNTSKISCLDKVFGSNVVLADNSLYYNVSAEDGTFLKKIGIDSKEPKILLTNPIVPACVDNSTLYYQNTKTDLHLMGIDLTNDRVRFFLMIQTFICLLWMVMNYMALIFIITTPLYELTFQQVKKLYWMKPEQICLTCQISMSTIRPLAIIPSLSVFQGMVP